MTPFFREELRARLIELGLLLAKEPNDKSVRGQLASILPKSQRELAAAGLPKDIRPAIDEFLWDSLLLVIENLTRDVGLRAIVSRETDTGSLTSADGMAWTREVMKTFAAEKGKPLIEWQREWDGRFEDPSLVAHLSSEEIEQYSQGFGEGPIRLALTSAFEPLLDEIGSLPRQYTAFVRLPFGPQDRFIAKPFSCDGLTVSLMDEDGQRRFDLSELVFNGLETQAQWKSVSWTDNFYLSVAFNGYVTDRAWVHQPIIPIQNELKALLGLGIACELLEVGENPAWDDAEAIFVFRMGERAHVLPLHWLPTDEAAVYGSINVIRAVDETAISNMRRRWHSIEAAFRRRDEPLLNAGRWLFGSFCGSNELLQLVQATIVLETLVGDQDFREGGIERLLANRTAYLIANSAAERREILAIVKQIYSIRSRIVHGGRNDLGGDTPKLQTLRAICARAIQKELQLLTVV